jgi:hypothetical protein
MRTNESHFKRLVAVVFIGLAPWIARGANTWYADASRPNDTGDGTSWLTAKQKIESAVALATGVDDVVLVTNGTYSPAAEISVASAITVRSVNGPAHTTVSGGGAHRCVNLNHANAVVKGFTLTGGYASQGGAAYVQNGVLRNCRLTGNIATHANYAGGGAWVKGPGVIQECLISNNTATGEAGTGGGLLLWTGRALNCTNVNNRAYGGGGVFILFGGTVSGGVVRANSTNGVASTVGPGQIVVRDCLIAGNRAGRVGGFMTGTGGGLYFRVGSSTALVSNCTISNNLAHSGGGVYQDATGGRYENCRIVNNTACVGGGALIMDTFARRTIFSGCVIASNVMTTSGFTVGGSPQGGGVAQQGYLTEFDHCVISNNVSVDTTGGAAGIAADYSYGPTVLRFSQIVGNRASGTGVGGIRLSATYGGSLSNCVIRGNVGNTIYGGGLYLPRGCLYNCLVAGNSAAASWRGGIYVAGNATTVDCCTVVGNSAVGNGGGISLEADGLVRNSIVYSNNATTASSKDFYFGSSANASCLWYTCYSIANRTPPAGRGNITSAPGFLNFLAGNYRLPPASPCVNAGTNVAWMSRATDLDGSERISGERVDMGAYEYYFPRGSMFMVR